MIQGEGIDLPLVFAFMGKMKDHLLREEERCEELMRNPAIAAAVNRRAARVSGGGGDAMGMMAILAALEEEAKNKGLTIEQLAEQDAAQEVSAASSRAQAAQASTLPAPPDPAPKHCFECAKVGVAIPSAEFCKHDNPTPPDAEQDRLDNHFAKKANEAVLNGEVPPDSMVVQPAIVFNMPPRDYMKQGQHYRLVFQGVCTNCAHCGMKLTDSVSIERGLGPVCSSRGYLEDPKDPDEMQAMIDLAEYPDLVDFLVKNYKPKGVRGLMNGLVKICSLNRRSPVHQACCDAIESLGYKTLASTLRESIAVIEIKSHDDKTFHLWVKKAEWHMAWQYDLRQIPGAYMSRQHKGWLVPKDQKHLLWALMIKHYEGFCAKVPNDDGGKRTVKITKVITPPKSQPTPVQA